MSALRRLLATPLIMPKLREHRWDPAYPMRIRVSDGIIDQISDYYPCPWMTPAAGAVLLPERSS